MVELIKNGNLIIPYDHYHNINDLFDDHLQGSKRLYLEDFIMTIAIMSTILTNVQDSTDDVNASEHVLGKKDRCEDPRISCDEDSRGNTCWFRSPQRRKQKQT